MKRCVVGVLLLLAFCAQAGAQEHAGEHPAPEKLGKVSFPTSCAPAVQLKFERAVALLHSFAYSVSEAAFREVAKEDANCALAGWGQAMANFHQLWDDRISPAGLGRGRAALEQAQNNTQVSPREREYVAALLPMFRDAGTVPYEGRLQRYAESMSTLAAHYPEDPEARIFYALALLAAAPADDKTHKNQKQAAELLEPLYRQFPEHPGVAHYLIHACDNEEMAPRGIEVAQVYAHIAPSAPHALHMPSHIFTRLGMWNESIQSNLAAHAAAERQGDTGEALHAMDYLVYAYLQSGRDADAAGVLAQLRAMTSLEAQNFKVGYASTVMPIRYAVERRQWEEAARSAAAEGTLPWVAATAVWARAIGLSRGGNPVAARPELETLQGLRERSLALGDNYWAEQVRIQVLEASAWVLQASSKPVEATAALRNAADEEDGIEKRPVTPGPITPAREQLADLLLEQGNARDAVREFENALRASPRRRGALAGALDAARQIGDQRRIQLYSSALHSPAE